MLSSLCLILGIMNEHRFRSGAGVMRIRILYVRSDTLLSLTIKVATERVVGRYLKWSTFELNLHRVSVEL